MHFLENSADFKGIFYTKNILTIFFALWYAGLSFQTILYGRCKMLDIYPVWLLVMAANFFILLFVLNGILYKPLLKIFKERDDTVKNSLDAANDMNKKREDSITQMNQELAEARSRAKETFDSLKNEGLEKSKETIKAAEAETVTILEKARAEVKAEAEKARNSLKAEVEKFSDEIVRKLVKV